MDNRMRAGSRIPSECNKSSEPEISMYPSSCSKAKRHWSQHIFEVDVKLTNVLQTQNLSQNQCRSHQNGNIPTSPQPKSTVPLRQEIDSNMNSLFRGGARRWSSGFWSYKENEDQWSVFRDYNWPLTGGAELGQFCRFTGEKTEEIQFVTSRRGRLHKNDVIMEVNDIRVAGFTLYDLKDLLDALCFNNVPIHLKIIRSGFLPFKLGDYMSRKYPSHTVDNELQEIIRENIYRRTIPYTTRSVKEGEIDGVEYRFILVNEFLVLERSGLLLESGLFEDNYYGTPFPVSRDSKSLSNSHGNILNLLPPSSPISQLSVPSNLSSWQNNSENFASPTFNAIEFGSQVSHCAHNEQFRVGNVSKEKNFGSIATISSQPCSSISSTSDNNPQKTRVKNNSNSSSSSSGSSSSVLAAGLLSTLLSTITISSNSSKTSATSQSSRNDVTDTSADRRKSMTESVKSDKKRKHSAY